MLALRNTIILAAVACSALHFFAFVALLSLWDLSLVVPLGALVYVLGTGAARIVLGESVSQMRWIGVCLIAAGVAIIAAS